MDLIKQNIINHALSLGFSSVGFSKAEFIEEESIRLKQWLDSGYQGKMDYLNNYFDLRTDPTLLHEGTQTIISLTFNYYNPSETSGNEVPKIAMYALGEDYHKVLRKKLKELSNLLKNTIDPGLNIRYFTDSAPIMERVWAKKSGLGWVGKNTLLINPKSGSYFFLAELLINLEIEPDVEINDHCGTCTRCIDACPTDAIAKDGYTMDGSKCISYLTIELKEDEIPIEFKDKMEGWAFGCDICQQVCPWNRFSKPHNEIAFNPNPELLNLTSQEWMTMDQETFDEKFAQSPIKRTGMKGMKRNVGFLE